jgi:hypothetical protein
MSSEGIFIPENIDVLLFGGCGEIGTIFKKTLVESETPLFAPPHDLIDLHHSEYVKMLIEGLKPQMIINCASYSGEDEEIIRHTNSLAPLTLSEICLSLDLPWMHVVRNHPARSALGRTCEEAVVAIKDSESKCYICKMKSSPEAFVTKCLELKESGKDHGLYEL